MIKNREEVEKEFDEKFCHDSIKLKYPGEKEYSGGTIVKSHISQIRKDDIDGLVEWVKERTIPMDSTRDCIIKNSTFRDSYNTALSDIIAYLQALKEKV